MLDDPATLKTPGDAGPHILEVDDDWATRTALATHRSRFNSNTDALGRIAIKMLVSHYPQLTPNPASASPQPLRT